MVGRTPLRRSQGICFRDERKAYQRRTSFWGTTSSALGPFGYLPHSFHRHAGDKITPQLPRQRGDAVSGWDDLMPTRLPARQVTAAVFSDNETMPLCFIADSGEVEML
jgi:hypothetical protein